MRKSPGRNQEVEFVCHARDAREVYLAGTFNSWSPNTNPLMHDGNGLWTITIELTPGRHEFKFLVDGEWVCESACDSRAMGCPQCLPNPFGSMNRFIEVS